MPDQTHAKHSSKSPAAAKGWDGQVGSLLAINERAFRSWARGISAFTEEMSRFTQARLKEDAETWQVLAACRSPMDALECQRRYAEKAAEQYLAEAGKLSQIAVSVASENLSSLQSEAAEASLSPL
jgi:phasin family protein